jgi:hydrogenase expression/formation protein HypC
MCVAAIGTVVSINGRLADVDFQGNIVHAEAGLVKVMAGDHVLVHAGCIIQKLTEQDNEFMTQLLEEVEEASRG